MKTALQDNEKKKNEDEQNFVDIDKLMNEIKNKILEVYFSRNTSSTVVPENKDIISKNAIQILHEIELNIVNNINVIDYILKYHKESKENANEKVHIVPLIDRDGYKLISNAEKQRKMIRSEQKKLV